MAQPDQDKTRETKNLLDLAKTTTQDLYALLSLPSPLTSDPQSSATDSATLDSSAIRRAYRKAALVHHPDKNPNNASAAAKFDDINKAYEILLNPEARHVYDERQRALREKAERQHAFEGKRKRMKEELERRESAGRRRTSSGVFTSESPTTPAGSASEAGLNGAAGVKRKFPGSPAATAEYSPRMSEEREAELRRLAAEGARRRVEQQEKMRKRRQEEASEASDRNDDDAANPVGHQASDSDLPRAARSFKFSSPSPSGKMRTGEAGNLGQGSSLFASTMARLKEAEKKRREEAALRGEATQTTDAVG